MGLHGLKPNWRRENPLLGLELLAHQKSELERELKRLALVQDQIDEVELTRIKILEESQSRCARVARRLMALVGVGPVGAWTLSYELFGWRKFRNRRQLGALVGMVGRPYNSGRMEPRSWHRPGRDNASTHSHGGTGLAMASSPEGESADRVVQQEVRQRKARTKGRNRCTRATTSGLVLALPRTRHRAGWRSFALGLSSERLKRV